MPLTGPFTGSFFSGTTASLASVPDVWPCALNGRGYLLDDAQVDVHVERSVPSQRQQLASSEEPGERSLNPEGAWRRAWSSWHHGAGQTHREGDSADTYRFRGSKGVNVWTRGQLTLLPDTTRPHTVSGTNAQMAASQQFVYYLDGNTVYRTNGATRTAVTGTPAATATSIASSGSAVYVAYGPSNVYKVTGTTASSFVASPMDLVGFAKQRILGASTKTLYDLSAGTATTVYDHIDASFVWTAIADGTSHIYAAGNSGVNGTIYRIAVTDDATALGKPVVAGRLPTGETVTALFGYAGLLFIGTSQGFRIAQQGSGGDLVIGPLVQLGVSVHAFAAWQRFVWFGWSNFDATSTGVGRIDPTVQHADGSYAYASDLMATATGTVRGVAVLNGDVLFGVDGAGVYAPTAATVASGTIDTGIVAFDVTEPKLLIGGESSYSGAGSVSLSVAVEGGAWQTLNTAGFDKSGQWFELRCTLSSVGGVSPTATSLMMRSYELSRPSRLIFAPLHLVDRVVLPAGTEERFDVTAALNDIRALWSDGTPTTYQEGEESWSVTVEDYEWRKDRLVIDGGKHIWCGTCVVKMKVLN